jgi:hypothetical protein
MYIENTKIDRDCIKKILNCPARKFELYFQNCEVTTGFKWSWRDCDKLYISNTDITLVQSSFLCNWVRKVTTLYLSNNSLQDISLSIILSSAINVRDLGVWDNKFGTLSEIQLSLVLYRRKLKKLNLMLSHDAFMLGEKIAETECVEVLYINAKSAMPQFLKQITGIRLQKLYMHHAPCVELRRFMCTVRARVIGFNCERSFMLQYIIYNRFIREIIFNAASVEVCGNYYNFIAQNFRYIQRVTILNSDASQQTIHIKKNIDYLQKLTVMIMCNKICRWNLSDHLLFSIIS